MRLKSLPQILLPALLIALPLLRPALADEGMWTHDNFPAAQVRQKYNVDITAAWLALDEPEQARLVAQAGWPQAARFELQPYWADYLALFAALDSRPRAAARLLGYADATYPAGEGREANEAAAVERARTLSRTALGDAEFARLHAEGAMLCDANIAALAFAKLDG